jgi:NAD(P)-dependent dehydrogenase (short-subunit alcohol dehydrogenase family)
MTIEIDLSGQVAVVTGGGAGLGRAIAVALASCGANVAIADIDERQAEQTEELVRKAGGRGLVCPADVLDTGQIGAAVQRAAAEWGRLDILVNNAGGVRARPFAEQSERSWRRHIDINLVSALAATAAAIPLLRGGGRGGAIINVASIEAFRAAPTFAVYAACKAALVSFTKTMALELGGDGIRVNCVAPDLIATPGLRGLRPSDIGPGQELPPREDDAQRALEHYVPLGREGIAAECGDVVAFLASSRASYISGVTLPIDGGTFAASGWVRSPRDANAWDLGTLPIRH